MALTPSGDEGEYELTLEVEGASDSAGDLLLDDWSAVLDDFRLLMRQLGAEEAVSKSAIRIAITTLSMNSPAKVGLGIRHSKGSAVRVSNMVAGLSEVLSGENLDRVPLQVLRKAETFTRRCTGRHVATTVILSERRYQVTKELHKKLEAEIYGTTLVTAVEGRLEQVSLHDSEVKRFRIYQAADRWVSCLANADFEMQLAGALKQWVVVFGDVFYRAKANDPVRVENITRMDVVGQVSESEVLSALKDLVDEVEAQAEYDALYPQTDHDQHDE
ncbi:MAG: hypothetical protein HKL81_10765 [Acidimicrobiaceae bacterium]|nr:hypothetical protein [Acidimicrobiaceae bacterium]